MLFIAIWFETHRRRHRGAFIESLGIISDRIELYFSTIPKFHSQSVINVLQLTCPVHVILHEDPLLPTSGCRTQATTGYDVVDKQAFTQLKYSWSVLYYFFVSTRWLPHWTHENEWVESYCLDSWLNEPIESFHEPIPTCHFINFAYCLCVFLFSNWIICRRGPLLLDFWLQQKNTHKTSLLFRTTRHIIISCISLMMNNSCDL